MSEDKYSGVAEEIEGLSPESLSVLREVFADYIIDWRDKILPMSNVSTHDHLTGMAKASLAQLPIEEVMKLKDWQPTEDA